MPLAEGNWVSLAAQSGGVSNDSALETLVRAELMKSPYPEIRAVRCRVTDGVLTLSGCIPSYYLKQVAQRLALNVLADAAEIVNQLHVVS